MSPFGAKTKTTLSLEGVSVMLAIPVNRDFPWQTNLSIVRTVCALKDRGVPFDYQLLTNGSIIEVVRSRLTHTFLKSPMNRMFFVDSDMSWTPDVFLRLLGLSTKMEIVGATYPAKRDSGTEFLMDHDGEFHANEWGCFPIRGMGLGFTCVKRQVIEELAERAPKVRQDGEEIPMIFHCDTVNGEFRGEDMTFFADCRELGYKVHVDPSIVLGHVGGKEYRGRMMDALETKVREVA